MLNSILVNNRTPEVIIFDYDGTLVDSEKITYELSAPIISKYLGRRFSKEELNSLKGKVWKNAFRKWLPDNYENLYQDIVENWKKIDPVIPLYPEIRMALKLLHNHGVKMAIASSNKRNFILKNLERLSISNFFEVVVGQEDTVNYKPDPDPLIRASELMKLERGRCIYIGDQVSDIEASKSAGMFSGGASWGEGNHAILQDASPDYIFTKPTDIHEVLFLPGPSEY